MTTTTRRAFLGSLAIAAAAPAAVALARMPLQPPEPVPPCIVTFGCTTRSQAERFARWVLYTDRAYANVPAATALWTDLHDGSFHVTPPVSR